MNGKIPIDEGIGVELCYLLSCLSYLSAMRHQALVKMYRQLRLLP